MRNTISPDIVVPAPKAVVLTEAANAAGLVIGSGVALTAGGLVVGIALAAALTGFISQLLHDVAPLDPWTFAVVPVALLAVAIAASALPAWRATQVDPVHALRAE